MKIRPTLILITLVCAAMVSRFGITSTAGQIWTPTGSMSGPRYLHTATLLPSGKVLVTGGNNGHVCEECVKSAELYDRASGLWAATGHMNARRFTPTATLLQAG